MKLQHYSRETITLDLRKATKRKRYMDEIIVLSSDNEEQMSSGPSSPKTQSIIEMEPPNIPIDYSRSDEIVPKDFLT